MTAAEYETDELLVQLVRVQHLTERVFQFNHRDQLIDESLRPSLQDSFSTDHLSQLRAEMQQLEASVPQKLKGNCQTPTSHNKCVQALTREQDLLSSHYSTVRIRVYESLMAYASTPSSIHPMSTPSADYESLNNYHTATTEFQSWLETWLNIPVCYYFYMPQPGYGHLIFAVAILVRRARLLLLARSQPTIASGGSDRLNMSVIAAQTIPTYSPESISQGLMIGALESLAARFVAAKEEIGVALGIQWSNDLLDLIARKIRARKSRIEKWVSIIATGESSLHSDTEVSGSSENEVQYAAVDCWSLELSETLLGDDDPGNWFWSDDLFLGT